MLFCMQVHRFAHHGSAYTQMIYHLKTCSIFNKTVHVRESSSKNLTFSSTTQQLAFNVANKPAKNPLRIQIYEQILVTGHSDIHPDVHSDHVFLTDNIFSHQIFGQTEAKLKIMAHGFCAEQTHFSHCEEFSQN